MDYTMKYLVFFFLITNVKTFWNRIIQYAVNAFDIYLIFFLFTIRNGTF